MPRDLTTVEPHYPGFEEHKNFHEYCRQLVRRPWKDDGHVGIVVIETGKTKLKMQCPHPEAHYGNAPCKDGNGNCLVKELTEMYGDASEFVDTGPVFTVVHGPVPMVWDAYLHDPDYPETTIAPKAALQYAANVSAMEFGKDSVKFDWWLDPTLCERCRERPHTHRSTPDGPFPAENICNECITL